MRKSLAIGLALVGTSAQAQTANPVAIRVGAIETAQECTLYEGVRYKHEERSRGRSSGYVAGGGSGYANAYGAGGSGYYAAGGSSSYSNSSKTSFETFFVKDCISHFEGIRSAMQSALASSGSVVIRTGGYVLTGRVEDVVPTGSGYVDQAASGQSYGSVSTGLRVTMSVKVADKAGRIVFGAPVVTEIETGSYGEARGSANVSVASGEGLYSLLQRQVAMVAARQVAFHFRPLEVIGGSGKKVQLNYGGPLLEVGTMLSVTRPDGSSAARYRITSVSSGSALAQQVGDADSTGIVAGSRATVIEKGDPAANQSTLERVDLP